jgi:DNA-binding CsgD family transcriptional regulator/tetratricopeptide (TPR) repeat protein
MILLERDTSLEALLTLSEDARLRRGRFAVIAGEAGIGKTSIVNAFVEQLKARAVPPTILWSWCDDLQTPPPLGPLHDLSPGLGKRVGDLLRSRASPHELMPEVVHALRSLPDGTVLIVEDVHWADNATLDLLKHVGRRIPALRVLIVLTMRNDDEGRGSAVAGLLSDLPTGIAQRIELERLTPDGVEAMAGRAGRGAEGLYALTGGNPFFLTEVLMQDTHGDEALPQSVKDAVLARLSRLDREERALLERLAVVPGAIDRETLVLLGGEDGPALAQRCAARGLLVNDIGGLNFRHALARMATLSLSPPSVRRETHELLLGHVLKDGLPERLDIVVHHAAGAQDHARVLSIAPLAAARAASFGAHREAASHLSAALQHVTYASAEQAAQLYEDWAYEAGLAIEIGEDVLAARRQAISLWRALGRLDKVGLNYRWLWRMHWYRGESEEARQAADEAVRTLESIEPGRELAMAYSMRAQLHLLHDRMDEAVAWGERALTLAETFDDIETRIHALTNIGSAKLFRADETGGPLMEQALALALEASLHEHAARVYTNYAESAVLSRNFELAERLLREGIAFDTRHTLDSWTYYLVGRLALLRLEQGRLAEAETIADGVLKLERQTLVMRLPALTVRAIVRSRRGEADAQSLLDRALEAAVSVGEPQRIIPVRIALVEHHFLKNRMVEARQNIDALLAFETSALQPWDVTIVALWLHRMGTDIPVGLLDAVEGLQDAPFVVPGRLERAGRHGEAAAMLDELGLPFEASMTRMLSRDPADVVQAVVGFDRISAGAGAAVARRIAADAGLTGRLPKGQRGPYAAAREHPLGLTRREQEILGMIAGGASNRDIADRLSRSERTVEHHVSALLGKLNCRSRMEAMLRVIAEPWLSGST